FYGDSDFFIFKWLSQPIPEIALPKLSTAVGQAWIENKSQGMKQVALTNAVLADDDDVSIHDDVHLAKVAKIANVNSCEFHAPSLLEFLSKPARRGSDTCSPH